MRIIVASMPDQGEEGVLILRDSTDRRVEFRGRPYSQWEIDEDTDFYRVHSLLSGPHASPLHAGAKEVAIIAGKHSDFPALAWEFEREINSFHVPWGEFCVFENA